MQTAHPWSARLECSPESLHNMSGMPIQPFPDIWSARSQILAVPVKVGLGKLVFCSLHIRVQRFNVRLRIRHPRCD